MLLREFFEAAGNEVAIIFGRFNPPHKGHRAAWEVAAKSPVWYVGTHKATVGPKDPLPFDVKINCMEAIWPEVASHVVAETSWLTMASMVYEKHKASVLYCCTDEDWVTKTVIQYNGKEGAHGYYNFASIEQKPTPRLSSATDLRSAVMLGDRNAFSKAAGVNADLEINGTPFFDLVAKYLLPYADTKSGKSSKASAKLKEVNKAMSIREGEGQRLSIEQLAHISDEALDNAYHYGRSTPGNTFGWQANLKSAEYAKRVIDNGETELEIIADAIHDGWNETARAFVQNPGQFDDTEKLMAAGKLDAKIAQREKLMNISYDKLPPDEQEKDLVVARALLAALTNSKKKVSESIREGLLDEVAAFHGSFRPRIGKFKPFSHFGTEKAANDRLHHLAAHDPRFKGQTTGYLYKLDLGINNPATVKDYPSLQDPSTGRMDKIVAWVNDLVKDPRVKSYVWNYKDQRGQTQQKTGVDRLKGIQYSAKNGYWREWESPATFLNRFVTALQDMGIDGLVYKNQVENKGEISYIAFSPDNVKVMGRAKPVNLATEPEPTKKKVKEGVIDEVADQPYRYMLTKKLPDARQYMFQTDSGTKFQVFFSLLDAGTEKIADVGFADQTDKDNPTIGVTGKGDAFRVFSTVGAIVKEYVNSVKPDFLSFNGKTQDPGRIKLYDMIAKNITRYLKDYEQSSHTMPGATDEKGYMLQRITKPVDEVSKVSLSSDPDNFGAWVRDGGTPEKTVVIPTSKIHVFEPDDKFDNPHHAKNLANIVKAIKAGKKLPPILVRRHGIDRFQVVDGHHRFMAYRMAGAKSIPARVVDPKNVKEV
jgi:hypothetical protein